MRRGIFGLGIAIMTVLLLIGVYFIFHSEEVVQEKTLDERMEDFLYKVWVGRKAERVEMNLNNSNQITNLYKVVEKFVVLDPSNFLEVVKGLPSSLKTNLDVELMKKISEKRVMHYKEFEDFTSYKIVTFKINYYGYLKLFGISNLSWKLYRELKDLLVYFHDKGYLDAATDIATNLLNLKVEDPEVLAYYGSTLTKYALEKSSPTEKMEYVARGSFYIDKAVSEYPDYLVPRLVRIFNYLSLPVFFNKKKYIAEDIGYILDKFTNSVKLKIVENIGKISYVEVPKEYVVFALGKIVDSKIFNEMEKKKYFEIKQEIEKY